MISRIIVSNLVLLVLQIKVIGCTSAKRQFGRGQSTSSENVNHHKIRGVRHLATSTYQEPPWWKLIQSQFTGVNLQKCEKKTQTPLNGSKCDTVAKTCFFGTQQCPQVGPYPVTECFCNGKFNMVGTWSCKATTCPSTGSGTPTPNNSSPAPTSPPTPLPTAPPTPIPTAPPTSSPTEPPTPIPTAPPTSSPTEPPTPSPTSPPTSSPTEPPTPSPTEPPTPSPAEPPTPSPTEPPTPSPTEPPSLVPSDVPSLVPSDVPSLVPSDVPSLVPSDFPSLLPSDAPSGSFSPTLMPSFSPTQCLNIDNDCPWTDWLNRDDPNDDGDIEDLAAFALDGIYPCPGGSEPLAIQCQAFEDFSSNSILALPTDAANTGEIISCNRCNGLVCINDEQPDSQCHYNYRIRFQCPCAPTAAPTAMPSTSSMPTAEVTLDCSSSTVGDFYINECEEKCICEETDEGSGVYEHNCYREREEITCMSPERRQRYIDAYKYALANSQHMRDLIYIHGIPGTGIHGDIQVFLPWHRWFLRSVEDAIRDSVGDCRVTMPWWRSSKKSDSWWIGPPFDPPAQQIPNWLGGDGDPRYSRCVRNGPFGNPWIPSGPANAVCLLRQFSKQPVGSEQDIAQLLAFPKTTDPTDYDSFASEIEGYIHAAPHVFVGGFMKYVSMSSNAPEFLLHHAYIDKIWDQWQTKDTGTFADPYGYGMNKVLPNTIPPVPNKVGDHIDLKKSGVIYVDVQSTTDPPSGVPPQCVMIAIPGATLQQAPTPQRRERALQDEDSSLSIGLTNETDSSLSIGLTNETDSSLSIGLTNETDSSLSIGLTNETENILFFNINDIQKALIAAATNGTLASIPQRPLLVQTIEEMKDGFFFTTGQLNGIADEVLEQQLNKTREDRIAANDLLEVPTTEFQDNTSQVVGFDLLEVARRFNVCPVGSTPNNSTGGCSSIDPIVQDQIDVILNTSTVVQGEVIQVTFTPAPSSESPVTLAPVSFAPVTAPVTGSETPVTSIVGSPAPVTLAQIRNSPAPVTLGPVV